MTYPIVNVKTKDDLFLHGLLLNKSKSVLISIHGTAGNFYEEDFIETLANLDISILSTNNRGAGVLQAYPEGGAATEHFEDCLIDIDAWIEFAESKGYENIVLLGHSLGTEKIVYYMNKGKHKDKVKAVILLGFSDSYGTQKAYGDFMAEAEELVKNKKPNHFIASDWLSHAGVLPKNADSYINFFREGSELSKALPFHKKELKFYKNISVPILAIIGDEKEYTLIPIKEAIELLKKENDLTEVHQIKDCSHDFEGKEEELTNLISAFLSTQKI